MAYIKKLVMHGFKSFARRTEISFTKGINVILGPNGSGKSNISDALCFVLGRLSIKSMRAAKARNLMFMGSKYVKPAREASVEMVFDNTDRVFAIEKDEISLKRIVRSNGVSIYKINDEVKTRIEVIEMLAQAGIDPYGFNLVLQGQIQAIVKMHPEERRKIIEEVAGIAIYESRKEKSLKELEKTDSRLKEISAVLREKFSYLRNLDKERTQAMKFKELETTVKRSKASILNHKIKDKDKELSSLLKSIEEKNEQYNKIKQEGISIQEESEKLSNQIEQITRHIQQSTGIEQEKLHAEIANLKAEIEGLRVRKEGYENRIREIERRIEEMKQAIPSLQEEINGLQQESPIMASRATELKKKKEDLALIEEEKKKLLNGKSELNSIREKIKDRERQLGRSQAAGESILKQIEEYTSSFSYRNENACSEALKKARRELLEKQEEIENLSTQRIVHERTISISEAEKKKAEKIIQDVTKIDLCPLCQSAITPEHISHVNEVQHKIISEAEKNIDDSNIELKRISEEKTKMQKEMQELNKIISSAEIEMIKHKSSMERHEQLKRVVEEEKNLKQEINELENKRKNLEDKLAGLSNIEEKYDSKLLEIEEISSRTAEDVDTTLLYKQREVENMHAIVKRSTKDSEELQNTIAELEKNYENKNDLLEQKENQEKELQAKFKKLFEEREKTQHEIQEQNLAYSEIQAKLRAVEDQINYLKIGKARLEAEKSSLEMELSDYAGAEILQGSIAALEEKLKKAQEALHQIGSINMRALEVYEEVKKEYDIIQEKTQTLEKEKEHILAIVAEIDAKKKRTFMKTFKAMSDLFSENFAKLYTKGVAFLELENKEDIFSGGVNIVVRLAKGKYFDVTSLSGGEQTLVALSLLFAIQEYKPYHFYILDEIDAALDKRNSERLAVLLQRYMKSGQYIVITHNDAIIMNAEVLYGISMHEGVSKVLSLNLSEAREEAQKEGEQAEAIKNQEIRIDSAPLNEQTLEEGTIRDE